MADLGEASLYQRDYYAWTKAQAAALRRLAEQRSNLELDLENLGEEVESLGRSELNTVRSQVRRIIEHLLKLEYSPAPEPRADWRHSVSQARDEVEDHITASMRPDVEADLPTQFARARREAAHALKKHSEDAAAHGLPAACPYSFDQIATHHWFPANRHGLIDDADED